MKKYIFLTLIAIAAISTSYTINRGVNKSNLSDTQLANIEALSQSETGGGPSYRIPCHSSAESDYNKAYVDCSKCERYEGWKGKGTEAFCYKRAQ